MTIPAYITDYWGKAMPRGDVGPRWHPLAYHSLDVAAAGEALLFLRPAYLDVLSRATKLPMEAARAWLLLALAVHDIGKFAECFQVKTDCIRPCEDTARRTSAMLADDPGHGALAMGLWKRWLDDEGGGPFRPVLLAAPPNARGSTAKALNSWMAAAFGHHGRPVEPSRALGNLISSASDRDARAFATDCLGLFPLVTEPLQNKLDAQAFATTSWLVAGLAMIADWVGSKQDDWFPYCDPKEPLADYWQTARARAQRAVALAGLSRPTVAAGFSLADALGLPTTPVVGTAPEPSPLQSWVIDAFAPTGQTLVVIEDLTGSGKTEAALVAAHNIMRAGAAGGLYWALPTMATANGLYARLARSYQRMFTDPASASLVLAHGKRDFNEAFKRSVLPAGALDAWPAHIADDVSASAQCAAWIADDRRKAFLADVGIGTIDQALLAVLPAKHQALRLAALSQRVLVVDEVHSYDPYMTRLLEGLLELHAAMGGSAILLSATMTGALRGRLVQRFARGAGWQPRIASEGFPLVTMVTAAGAEEQPLPSGRGTRRDLPVRRLANEDEAVSYLRQQHANGRSCVWIRNTVHDAINAWTRLGNDVGKSHVDLFHARFALGDRIDHETRALETFGRTAKFDRNRILVATQVVEQSLDLDFDVMISDLAPIDLLIQRAGRLHRHQRGVRPAPELCVVSPEAIDDARATWYAATFQKAQYVYPDHGQLWLTMRYLGDRGGLDLASRSPREPIETVFAAGAAIPAGLEAVSGRAAGRALAQRGHAAMNELKLAEGYALAAGAWASDERTPTRLGSPQRLLRLARWKDGTLAPWYRHEDRERAWRLSEVGVLAARIEAVVIEHDLLQRACDAELARWPERFEPPLLVPLVEAGGGLWRATVRAKDDSLATLFYSNDRGLVFEPSSPPAQG